ncbi:MAG: hypothetical protein JNK72_03480 [Myxococcales bacterium]|nr:hypothetical protein [Myxococcales bacterium]
MLAHCGRQAESQPLTRPRTAQAPVDASAAPARPQYGPAEGPAVVSQLRFGPASTQPCAQDSDCRQGLCFTAALDAQYSSVFRDCPEAQAWRAARTLGRCLRPACQSDAECPAGSRCGDIQMLPFPERTCVPAACRSDADCRARRQGQCVQYVVGRRCEHGGWACSYPGDACAPHDLTRRCAAPPGSIGYCIPHEGRFRCVVESSPMP